jgi:hypothetical protein
LTSACDAPRMPTDESSSQHTGCYGSERNHRNSYRTRDRMSGALVSVLIALSALAIHPGPAASSASSSSTSASAIHPRGQAEPPGKTKGPPTMVDGPWTGATGFEPAVFGLTGRHVKPLHHAPNTVPNCTQNCSFVKSGFARDPRSDPSAVRTFTVELASE